jgi:hypothetical protein
VAVGDVIGPCAAPGCSDVVVRSSVIGRTPRYCGTHRDPSERKRAERAAARKGRAERARVLASARTAMAADREHRRQLARLVAVLRAAAPEVARRQEDDALGPRFVPRHVERTACGCGRDYLTLPLEGPHTCPQPLPVVRRGRRVPVG